MVTADPGVPVCQPPAPVTVAPGTPVAISLPCLAPAGQQLTREIVTQPQHGTLGQVDQTAGTVTFTAPSGYVGADSFSFRGRDADGASPAQTVPVQVIAAPTAGGVSVDAVTDSSAVLHGTLNPGGGQTGYYFTVTAPGLAAASTPVQMVAAGSADVSVSAPIAGLQPGTAYTAILTASNASGSTTSAAVAFTTTPASIPVQAHLAAPATADTGQDIPLDGSASSGAGLTYSWSTDAPGAEHVSGSHPTLSVRFDVPGSHQVTLTVTDAAGHSDTTTRTVAVSAPTLYATVLDPLIPTAGRPEHIKVRAADANGRLSPLPAGTLVTLGGDSAVRSRGSVISGILLPGRDVSSTAT